MTPVPLDLPLRPPEAAELASLIFDLAERKPLTDDIRNRIAARAVPLRLESLKPYFGSLARDPIHHSTYYIAVDVPGSPAMLLHMALASAPTSSIFYKPLLIGRMRRSTGPEIVINAVPFAVADAANIDKFAAGVDTAFLPRPHRFNTAIVVDASSEAFDAFRSIWKRLRKNVATVSGPYHAAVWTAIRSGWREGYSVAAEIHVAGEASLLAARESIREFPLYSRFVITGTLTEVERLSVAIRQARSAAKVAPAFDLGISTEPEDLAASLQNLRDAGHPAQIAAPKLERSRIAALAAVARQFNCVLSVNAAEHSEDDLKTLARETAGRFSCTVAADHTRNIVELAGSLLV
jgi:hypothetical protein